VSANEAAQDLYRAGRLREARAQLATCIAESCPGAVREDCAQRLQAVDAAMPTLVFEVLDDRGHDVSAVEVWIDGTLVARELDGTAGPVDPGEHQIVIADALGRALARETILVREGDKARHVDVVLRAMGAPPARAAAPAPTTVSETTPKDAEPPSRTGAYLALGGAGIALAAGAVFTALALQARSSAQAACGPGGHACPGDASTRNAQIDGDAFGAVTGFGAALAGASLGVILLLSPQPSTATRSAARVPPTRRTLRVEPRLGLGWAGVEGSF